MPEEVEMPIAHHRPSSAAATQNWPAKILSPCSYKRKIEANWLISDGEAREVFASIVDFCATAR
jgi:hypothetical protein